MRACRGVLGVVVFFFFGLTAGSALAQAPQRLIKNFDGGDAHGLFCFDVPRCADEDCSMYPGTTCSSEDNTCRYGEDGEDEVFCCQSDAERGSSCTAAGGARGTCWEFAAGEGRAESASSIMLCLPNDDDALRDVLFEIYNVEDREGRTATSETRVEGYVNYGSCFDYSSIRLPEPDDNIGIFQWRDSDCDCDGVANGDDEEPLDGQCGDDDDDDDDEPSGPIVDGRQLHGGGTCAIGGRSSAAGIACSVVVIALLARRRRASARRATR